MHKKGITEEVAKKRSRRTVKHQRGVVGADITSILARRNQTEQIRSKARLDAIAKAKDVKKEKEAKKEKTKVSVDYGSKIGVGPAVVWYSDCLGLFIAGSTADWHHCSQDLEATGEAVWWKQREPILVASSMRTTCIPSSRYTMNALHMFSSCRLYVAQPS